MSDNMEFERRRNQTLLIVEGNHEKNIFFDLIFCCYTEMDIDIDNIWIYGTHIYMLYQDIEKEYGENWEEDDIDLPFIVSKKKCPNKLRYENDFTNIILVFDYERHDANFSEEKIVKMQRYFDDATDVGKLYINYPMIEAYQHLKSIPDDEYAERNVPVTLQPGREYKSLVRHETGIGEWINFPRKAGELLYERFGIENDQQRKNCLTEILNIAEENDIDKKVGEILKDIAEKDKVETAKHQFEDLILKLKYVQKGQPYWEYMRAIFRQIVYHNICKANKIQNGQYCIADDDMKECFENLDLSKILAEQNRVSQDDRTGFIWVLSTSVFFIAEYNFDLLQL